MNCPNCGKQPLGFIHFIKFGGVGFSKNILGYFRCRNCDTLLKYQRFAGLFVRYDFRFWLIFPLMFVMILYLPELLTDLAASLFPGLVSEGTSVGDIFFTTTFFLTLIAAFIIIFRSMFRYVKFEMALDSHLAKDEKFKMNPAGWIIFAAFLVVYLFIGHLLLQNAEMFSGSEIFYVITFIIYLGLLVGFVAVVTKTFSFIDSGESEPDAIEK